MWNISLAQDTMSRVYYVREMLSPFEKNDGSHRDNYSFTLIHNKNIDFFAVIIDETKKGI